MASDAFGSKKLAELGEDPGPSPGFDAVRRRDFGENAEADRFLNCRQRPRKVREFYDCFNYFILKCAYISLLSRVKNSITVI